MGSNGVSHRQNSAASPTIRHPGCFKVYRNEKGKVSAGNANVRLGRFGQANVWRSKPRYVCPCVISGDARIRRKRFNGLSHVLGRQRIDPGGPPASRGFAKPRSHCGARCHQGERSVCDAADSLRGSHVGSAADDRWAGNQGSEVMS